MIWADGINARFIFRKRRNEMNRNQAERRAGHKWNYEWLSKIEWITGRLSGQAIAITKNQYSR